MELRPQERRRSLAPTARAALGAILGAVALSSCNRGDFSDGPSFVARRPSSGGSAVCFLPSGCPCPPDPQDLGIRINEVMLENESTLEDDAGAFSPWVELYNSGDEAVDLGGVPFSDDLTSTEKWEIPCEGEAVVPARGFLVLFLDGEAENLGGLHATFRATADALGSITLVLNRGTDIVTFQESRLEPDVSAGRYPDGEGIVQVLAQPTPGSPNAEPVGGAGGGVPFLRGDATEDNRVDIADLTFISRFLFQSAEPPACQDRLDVNDDSAIDVADSAYLGNALFLDGPTIPEPFPRRGTDPTPDELLCLP